MATTVMRPRPAPVMGRGIKTTPGMIKIPPVPHKIVWKKPCSGIDQYGINTKIKKLPRPQVDQANVEHQKTVLGKWRSVGLCIKTWVLEPYTQNPKDQERVVYILVYFKTQYMLF